MSGAPTGLEIADLDPFDVAMFDAWHAVYLAADTFGREEAATPWQLEEFRVAMQHDSIRTWQRGWCGLADGELVVVAMLEASLLDNLDRALVSVHTRPDQRRCGFGTALLTHVERVARERGRSLLGAESSWSHEAGPDGWGQPGPEFARAHGFDLGLTDVQRTLALPVDEAVLSGLAAEAAPHHTAYTLRSWVGPVPDELLAGWAELSASIMTEAPMGELDLEPEAVDAAAVREGEAVLAAQGRTKYNTVALDGAGVVVAYTDIATTIHEPGRAYQWGTLVRGADRGHRLGLAVKTANLQLLHRERPDISLLTTYNADVNAAMIGVNERFGFTPVAHLGEFQKRLA